MPSRWDSLLDQKPVPLAEHLLSEAAKLLGRELSKWPIEVREIDMSVGREAAAVLEPGALRPADAVFREAFRLARWDLQRAHDAYDDYMRNRRWLERGLAAEDRAALLVISRWLVEQMLSLGDATESRFKRPQMIECLDRTEREWARLRGGVEPTA